MARQMLLAIGAEVRQDSDNDDRVAGIRAIYDWLEQKGINTAGMVIDNGSGVDEQRALQADVAAVAPRGHEVSIVLADENLGFAAAMSRGSFTLGGARRRLSACSKGVCFTPHVTFKRSHVLKEW